MPFHTNHAHGQACMWAGCLELELPAPSLTVQSSSPFHVRARAITLLLHAPTTSARTQGDALLFAIEPELAALHATAAGGVAWQEGQKFVAVDAGEGVKRNAYVSRPAVVLWPHV